MEKTIITAAGHSAANRIYQAKHEFGEKVKLEETTNKARFYIKLNGTPSDIDAFINRLDALKVRIYTR